MLNRRKFLQESMAVVSLGLAVPSVFSKAVAVASEQNYAASLSGKALIIVQMAGGVDGLNTVIPYTDGAYRDVRRVLAIREEDMHGLNERVAFHPAWGKMKQLFDEGKMAVIEGVGYPQPSLSHFKAMDIWQSANLNGTAKAGWLGRYFEGLTDGEGHPMMGLSYGNQSPAAFNSTKAPIPAVTSIDSFLLQDGASDKSPEARRSALLKLYDIYQPANNRFAALLDATVDNAYGSSLKLKEAHATYKPAVRYPQSSLASGLQLLAELIDAQAGLRVGHVMIGGFDTHTGQANRLDTLLRDTSDAIHAFWTDLEAHGKADNVLLMSWSEFGRRVRENAQAGTDHGTAGPMFIIGSAVKGGLYGEPPDLVNLDNGNLRFTTDFRSVYATILERWLKSPSDEILQQRFPQIDFVSV